ncbi:MAG: FHA domain-containing protein, partial [Verrucomicrobia bacterium]|nr:FHA domain-containing protein [Verrucomicrobiota bacterium]
MTTDDNRFDSLFDDEDETQELAHVDFDLLDTTGRWFLKVLSGPNTGAEFSMQSGTSYLVGTDSATCDIVFQDLSVSRQHARISIDSHDRVAIEDLNSRNGTFVDGEKLLGRKAVISNALVSMGTTTFMLIDREGERQTIVSPIITQMQGAERKEET